MGTAFLPPLSIRPSELSPQTRAGEREVEEEEGRGPQGPSSSSQPPLRGLDNVRGLGATTQR